MNWKAWQAGLMVSFLSGLLAGIIALAVDMTTKQIVLMLLINIAKDGLLYLKSNPVDNKPPAGPPSGP